MSTLPPERQSAAAESPVVEHNPSGSQPSQAEQSRLADLWTRHSKPATTFQRYKKVSVLMLYWEDSDLNTKPEIDTLAEVFEAQYKFQVYREAIGTSKSPQVQLNYILGKFVFEHAEDDTLLIIYYAGHGHAPPVSDDGPRELLIAGRTNQEAQKKREMHSAAWLAAEHNLQNNTADVLAIFDCCYAGVLCQPRERSFSRFEYLGACSAEQRTPPPGKHSFTAGLIWALEKLKNGRPFTTLALRQKVVEYPKFPKTNPIIASPFDQARDPVMICPISSKANNGQVTSILEQLGRFPLESLDLRFHFLPPISDEALIETAQKLRDMFHNVDSITFLAKHTPADRAEKWVNQWRQWTERNKQLAKKWGRQWKQHTQRSIYLKQKLDGTAQQPHSTAVPTGDSINATVAGITESALVPVPSRVSEDSLIEPAETNQDEKLPPSPNSDDVNMGHQTRKRKSSESSPLEIKRQKKLAL